MFCNKYFFKKNMKLYKGELVIFFVSGKDAKVKTLIYIFCEIFRINLGKSS